MPTEPTLTGAEGEHTPLRFTVLTLFPAVIRAYLAEGVLGRALERGLATVDTLDIREFAQNRYKSVDDVPFGGGAGMVLQAEPVAQAIEAAGPADARILLSPQGRTFRQADARRWSKLGSVVLLCGRYEGIDERVCERFIDERVSIGDFVLSGGELGALVLIDATLRLMPGVLGNAESIEHESFSEGLLEHPHYTRPSTWRGAEVPEVLLSGHHARIAAWRREASLRRTARFRPDLLEQAELSAADQEFLRGLANQGPGER